MTFDLLSDEEVFAVIRDKNDEQAFTALYRRYDKRVYAYCLRALGNHEEAQDVFQLVMMTIYDKRQAFVDGSFAAWLFTITRNSCLKAIRNRKNTTELNEDIHTPDEHDGRSADFMLKDALQHAIKHLADEFREALELRYFDELSYEEIAQTLGISVSLAKVRVFRAKQQITNHLSPILNELK
ncbi:MAG: RNA polymerase sigma factor [Bradyrhizobiaceae bacterium]|nr:RNA polymerase sigma factor [Bradyrhizobiaceae bacterium]